VELAALAVSLSMSESGLFIYLVVLGLELRPSYLLARCSNHPFFCTGYF
jgi:hypothetical protein